MQFSKPRATAPTIRPLMPWNESAFVGHKPPLKTKAGLVDPPPSSMRGPYPRPGCKTDRSQDPNRPHDPMHKLLNERGIYVAPWCQSGVSNDSRSTVESLIVRFAVLSLDGRGPKPSLRQLVYSSTNGLSEVESRQQLACTTSG